jgi:flagellar hook-length control protein FliK
MVEGAPTHLSTDEILAAADEAEGEHRVRMPEFTRELRSLVVRTLSEGGREARMSLNPPELGQVKVTLTERNGRVMIRLEVESPAVRDQLLANQSQLGDGLKDQGIDLETLEVDVQGRNAGDEPDGKGAVAGDRARHRDEPTTAHQRTDHEPQPRAPALLGRVDVMA